MKLKYSRKFLFVISVVAILSGTLLWQAISLKKGNVENRLFVASASPNSPSPNPEPPIATPIPQVLDSGPVKPINQLVASVVDIQHYTPDAWKVLDTASTDVEKMLPDTAVKNTAQIIRLNPNFFEQQEMNLTLPDGLVLQMTNFAKEESEDTKSWLARNEDQPDLTTSITLYNGAFAGRIQTEDAEYIIFSLDENRQVIYQADIRKIQETILNQKEPF